MIHIEHNEAQNSNVIYSFQQKTFTLEYPCQSYSQCSPYKINFERGVYKLEIWGASGGNCVQGSINAKGGYGGYATGILIVHSSKVLYLHLGGHHDVNKDTDTVKSETTYNGGGETDLPKDAPGGGASDFRTQTGDWTATLNSRILVAGGGGGARIPGSTLNPNRGGNGGGLEGKPGEGETESRYGTQTGIDGAQPTGGYYNGTFGVGGKYWGTGGGGWYGGSSHQDSGGGGGSGHINPTEIISYLDIKAETKTSEHVGPGRAVITIIRSIPCTFGNSRFRLSFAALLFTLFLS